MSQNIGKKIFFAAISILVIFGARGFSHTPVAAAAITPDFQLAITPPNPAVGDDVVAQVIAINFATSTTNFVWFVNGTQISDASGVGKDTYRRVASTTNLTTIKVTVDPGQGYEIISRTALFRAQDYSDLQNALQNISGGGGGSAGGAGGGGLAPAGLGVQNSFTLSSSDDNPGPNENITVTLQSYSFDKSITRFRWSVNGAVTQTGVGLTTYSFTTGKIGSRYSIRATALFDNGTSATQTTVLNVSDIQFYWWTNTYVPAWFKGKALPVTGSPVFIYAMPQAVNVNPKTAIYKWSVNDSVVPTASGQGRSVFQFTPQFSGITEHISAAIQNAAGESIGEKTLDLTATNPQINIYAVGPLEGVLFNQTGNRFRSKPETFSDFIAEPFYFGVKTVTELLFAWSFNNQPVTQAATRPNIFGIQAPKGFIADQFVSVQVSHPQQKNESATQSFAITYNRQ